MASGTSEGTPGSWGTEVRPASPMRAEGEKGDSKGKGTLDTIPEFFAEEPSEKRRREQELAYSTLQECVIELRRATNGVKEMLKL